MGKQLDGSDKRQIWVMTINRTWDMITFWDAKAHKHYNLKGRITESERNYLEWYLSPKLTQAEKDELMAERARRKAERSMRMTLGTEGSVLEDAGGAGGLEEDGSDEDDSVNSGMDESSIVNDNDIVV